MSSQLNVVNRLDRERLLPHLTHTSPQAEYLRWLLTNSRVVPPERIPSTVVTMNSTVRLRDAQRDEEEVFTLIYPDARGAMTEFVSVLSPLGAALLSRREGDRIGLVGTRASRSLVLDRIEFQPERVGKFDM
jgi:regulator of nucleoside diphosphate kinase